MRCVLSCLGSWDVCIESSAGDWARVFTRTYQCWCALCALHGADVITGGGQISVSLPDPGPFLSHLDIAGHVRGLPEHLAFCFWQLELQPRLVMEKSYTLQWPRREWEPIKGHTIATQLGPMSSKHHGP